MANARITALREQRNRSASASIRSSRSAGTDIPVFLNFSRFIVGFS
jgi:hypothetical protein